MSIDPTKASGSHPLIDGAHLQAAGNRGATGSASVRPAETGSAAADAGPRSGDSVEISQEARGRAAAGGQTPSGIPVGHFREILVRLTSGHYDTTQVLDQVARKLQSDPALSRPE
jgi:hypothetical protein